MPDQWKKTRVNESICAGTYQVSFQYWLSSYFEQVVVFAQVETPADITQELLPHNKQEVFVNIGSLYWSQEAVPAS